MTKEVPDSKNIEDDPELFADQIASEVMEELAASQPEPEVTETEETPAEPDDEIPDSEEEDTGTEQVADDAPVEEPDSEDDEEDVDAFREEFAGQRGFNVDDLAGFSIDQMETIGRNLDRQVLSSLQQQQPQQPPQQNFNQPFQPQPQQQHFQPNPQHLQPQAPPQFDLAALKRKAEEEGYDPETIQAMENLHQQNVELQRRQQWFTEQQQRQQHEQHMTVINAFDRDLDNLKVTGLFGESKQSAHQNPLQYQAREYLFNQSFAFSRQTGQPLDSNLIGRVAQLLFPEQFQKQQQKLTAQKAMKQHKSKLGTSKSGTTPKRSAPKANQIAEEYGDEVANVLADAEVQGFLASVESD